MNQPKPIAMDDPNVIDFSEHPGRRLRVQRQTRGLELERVASQLHLRRDILEALEQDRYETLPDPVFVAGYLRNYARLLGLDPTPLVAAYRAAIQQQPPERVPSRDRDRDRDREPVSRDPAVSRHGSGGLVALVLLLAVLGAVALWWYDRSDTDMPGLSGLLDAWLADAPPPSGTPDAPASAVAPDMASPAAAPESGVPMLRLPPPPPASTEMPQLAPPVAPHVAENAPADTAAAVPPAAPALTVAAPSAPAETASPRPESREVVFEFARATWVEVRDAGGRSLLTGTMRKGDRKVVAAPPPLTFVVGNANTTRMTVDGATFDLAPHARGNVARFTLDPASGSPSAAPANQETVE